MTRLAAVLVFVTLAPALRAQQADVHGRVVEDGSGVALPGVRITAANARAVTDARGNFRIRVDAGATIAVRAALVGYVPATQRVTPDPGLTTVDFVLTRIALALDEVVVTGSAGPTRVRELGHSVGQIVASSIPEPVPTIDNLLSGKIPGVSVVQASGMAGSGAQVRLRGNTSVSLSNQPLVYLDGVRIRSDGYPRNAPPSGEYRRGPNDMPSPLNDINPSDVERVEIVRGPAATTLYGTDAATGVIQIFTRRGAAGKPLWNADLSLGSDKLQSFGPSHEPYLRLDPWLRSASRAGGGLSVSGGDEVRYYMSGSFASNEGVLPNDKERRALFRGNLDFSPMDKLALAWSTSLARNDISNTPSGENAQGLPMNAYRGDNNFTGVPGKESIDRILDWDITTQLNHLVSGITATFTPSPSMGHVLTFGYDRAEAELRSLRPFGFLFTPLGILSDEKWNATTLTADYLGRVRLSPSDAIGATLAWGGQAITNEVTSLAGYSETFPGPGNPTINSGALTLAFESRMRTVNAGVFSQLLVGLRDRLFLTAGLRLDGSSAFGSDLGFQAYPRFNASYVMSDESFWPRSFGIMRVRAAYGHAGRAPGAFDAERTWIQLGYQGKPALAPRTVGNSKLGPERTAETELGFTSALFEDRLRADFTWYRRTTSDALFPVTQTPSLGFLNTQLENVGKVRASGIELAIDASLVQGNRFDWSAGLDIATNHSKVLTLGGAPSFVIGDVGRIAEGLPTPTLIGTRIVNPDELADPVFEANHVYGPNMPTRVIGLRSSLRSRGFELSGRAEYSGGNFLYDNASRHLAQNNAFTVCNDAYRHKTEGNPELLTAWERVYCNPLTAPQDGPIWPASFVRLRALSLSMPVPGSMMRARSATLTLATRNILLWKNDGMPVFDPEMVGKQGMNSVVRAIEMQIPSPMNFTMAIRASYW